MPAYSHEFHELARLLGDAQDATQELRFTLARAPDRIAQMRASSKQRAAVDPEEIEIMARRLKADATKALNALSGAHALARVIDVHSEKEGAA